MMKSGDKPFFYEDNYQLVLKSDPDMILIMLGTNDAKTYQWNETDYVQSYIEMADQLLGLNPPPKLYFMIPPPEYREDNRFKINQTIINDRLPVIIPKIAGQFYLGESNIINIFDALGGKKLESPDYFCNDVCCDGTHPVDAGYNKISKTIYKKLFEEVLFDHDPSQAVKNKLQYYRLKGIKVLTILIGVLCAS